MRWSVCVMAVLAALALAGGAAPHKGLKTIQVIPPAAPSPSPTPQLVTPSPSPSPTPLSQPAFDRLKGLVGEWRYTDEKGSSTGRFQMEASGGAVRETTAGYVAFYTRDGDTLVTTVYTEEGTQPTLRAAGTGLDSLTFTLDGVTNCMIGQGFMKGLRLEIVDADHMIEHWTWTENGRTTGFDFPLVRVQPGHT